MDWAKNRYRLARDTSHEASIAACTLASHADNLLEDSVSNFAESQG